MLLSPEFEYALLAMDGVLHPVLSLVHNDRDVILEIRDDRVDLYCKGNILFQVERNGDGYQVIQPNQVFTEWQNFHIDADDNLRSYIASEIPFIKHRIACHRAAGIEIEFEQAIVRAANFEKANPHYLIVDRQVRTDGGASQIDCVGILWEDHRNLEVHPVLCEVKYRTGAVGYMATAIKAYYDFIRQDFDGFKVELQNLLHQKARLGLFPGLGPDARRNLPNLEIVGSIDDLKIVVALVDYSPNAGPNNLAPLAELRFARQITIQKIGFAMWTDRGTPLP